MLRHQFYERLLANHDTIRNDARTAAKTMGLNKFNGQLGLSTSSSSCPGQLAKPVWDALNEARKTKVLPARIVEDQLRELVKETYGDDFDCVALNTCESALRVTFDTLLAPPIMARGYTYRTRFIAPYTLDDEYVAGYGRPFPPKYKNLFADRSVSAGETSVEAKALPNVDAVFVKLVGAKYEVHGINSNPCPLLADVEAEKSAEKIGAVASRHAETLSGFETLSDDTPGFGYGAKDANGVPILQESIGRLAAEYDVPYIVDAARAVPIVGIHPRKVHATVTMYSMDKTVHGITSGLLIGREEEMVPIRKAVGVHGGRLAATSTHGKAAFSFADPGRDAVISQIAILKTLKERPETIRGPVDEYYSVLNEEVAGLEPSWLRDGLVITKSYHVGCVEMNYEHTWDEGRFGIPIFSIEDNFSNTNLLASALTEMGIFPPPIYGGNIQLTSGMGDLDEDGKLIRENVVLSIRGLIQAMNIVCKNAGLK